MQTLSQPGDSPPRCLAARPLRLMTIIPRMPSPDLGGDLLQFSNNLEFLDDLYGRWRADPTALDSSWGKIFDGRGALTSGADAIPGAQLEARFLLVHSLVNAFRARGHLAARLDPLDHLPREPHPDLDPASYGFSAADLERVTPSGGLHGISEAPLGEILRRLTATYCGSIGVEMMHITSIDKRVWLQERMEPTLNAPPIDRDTRLYILDRLTAAEVFERFVHAKYVGTKRFSLEGGESLIPLVELVLERAGLHGVEEAVIGMAHRGRLNMLVNVIGKSPSDVFGEFEDIDPESMFGGGDVKYHLGFSSDRVTRAGDRIHLSLAFNPSHLEAVNPVVAGRVRAKQRRRRDERHERVLGLLIHGDAAFAGQGLVAETLNLSHLPGYKTGGTVHVIVNNQIGFTTLPAAYRSTPYPTDVAKAIQAPILHVNGDDPEAVAEVVRLAMDYRREWKSDVVIDLFCYRKYGHNEGDEPAFTQPILYQKIERHPTARKLYAQRLIGEGLLTQADAEAIVERHHHRFEEEFARARGPRPMVSAGRGYWAGYLGGPDRDVADADTAVPRERLAAIAERLTTLPEGFNVHPKVQRILKARAAMGTGEQPLDWAMAEALAFGSLVWDGSLVRVSGQDSRRGTFSQRHAAVVDQTTEREYIPLEHVRDGQGRFVIYDSPLSEAAVLGFEYGYSLDYPDGLVVWEAQFGDFVNGAQVIIDQFIASAEDKWRRLSGLTLLLPHGFEGQGPEHSSARFDRFLELAAEDNLQVCYPSTPAQYFHLLRRQVVRRWRKPLVVLTPKSLLRLPAARSRIEELSEGGFQRVIDDPEPLERSSVKRILFCSGKIYYDLVEERRRRAGGQTAIVRLEQFYPLRDDEVTEVFGRYPSVDEVVWVQEEPANMGARDFLYMRLRARAGERAVRAVTRPESASPATGSFRAHAIEQQELLRRAFAPFAELEIS